MLRQQYSCVFIWHLCWWREHKLRLPTLRPKQRRVEKLLVLIMFKNKLLLIFDL